MLPAFFIMSIVVGATEHQKEREWPPHIQTVLENTKPLEYERGNRLPLYLWQAMNPGTTDEVRLEELVRELDRRGVGLIASWNPKQREKTLAEGLAVASVQKRLGLRVNVNANACLYSFYDDTPETAHLDEAGKIFWDESYKRKLGCPFRLDHRIPVIRERIEFFVSAYAKAGLPIDFVFADWEIDGPIEWGKESWEAAKRCKVCREHSTKIENFSVFQETFRKVRSRLQKEAYADPITSRYPEALVGNYAVYPHDGYRYWYDYFEEYVEGQPCRIDQRARYRPWFQEFPLTGYTFAMPTVYTWYPTFGWYDFEPSDYRWFYNMLLVGSNAGEKTSADIPIISFVHWHTTAPPDEPDPAVKQLSEEKYQELLWHLLLRGHDTLFLWSPHKEAAKEISLVHPVYAEAQQYGEFLEKGTPITFEVPREPGPVVSGIRLGERVLVRRTDFTEDRDPVNMNVDGFPVEIPAGKKTCQILKLE
jgi:hypothetical protein